MAINLDDLLLTFFEESEEHLNFIENALLSFNVDSPDLEEINSIFRAAHSIKGGAGVFSLELLIDVTHLMENILDLARNSQLTIITDTVSTLLETNDLLRTLMEQYRNHEELDTATAANITERLNACLAGRVEKDIDTEDDSFKLDPELAFGFEQSDTESTDSVVTSSDKNTEPSGTQEEDLPFAFFDEPEIEAKNGSENTAQASAEEDAEAFGFFDTPAPKKAAVEDEIGFFDPPVPKKPEDNPQYGFFKQNSQSELSSKSERRVNRTPAKKSGSATEKVAGSLSSSIRVDTQKIDNLVNLVGELVITQSILQVIGAEVTGQVKQRLQTAVSELKRNTREIQDSVMSMRMLPISNTFDRFPRVVRDLSTQLGKNIELLIEGGATEIDKGMIEKLVDPLTHLVRNSIDHGIEMPEQRILSGKTEKGHITLSAEQRGGSIILAVIDDGAGLNRDKILSKAREKGIHCHSEMSDAEVWDLIFEPGFSTANAVTDVSGRGVGMDVVRRNIETIGGRIEIDSTPGKGCAFQIQLPLTLAILDGMCVTVGDQVFVIPLANIIESLQPLPSQLKEISNGKLLWIRDQYWPLVSMSQFMQTGDRDFAPEDGVVVLVQTNKKRFGLVVNNLVGQQQVVIKSLEKHYKKVAGVAGATIMGDGSVALIVDIESIADSSKVNVPELHEEVAL